MFIEPTADEGAGKADGAVPDPAAVPPPPTDCEASLLLIVLRRQPVTAYRVLRLHALSPVSRCNESKGSLYPLVRRLKARGLLAAGQVAGDGRGAQLLTCTAAGREAVRSWARRIGPEHMFAGDPLFARIDAFDLLSAAEWREWVATARRLTETRMAELEGLRTTGDMPVPGLVHAGALRALHGRLEWLDQLSGRLERPAPRAAGHPPCRIARPPASG
jgi:DNA-binding PadR family transcriptional regulator